MDKISISSFEYSQTTIKTMSKGTSDIENYKSNSEKVDEGVEKSETPGYKFSISPEAAEKALTNSSLIQVSISMIQSIQRNDGTTETRQIDINAMLARFQQGSGETQDIGSIIPGANMEDFTSPESTAERIFNFSLGRWGQDQWGETDTKELRSKYKEYIMPAIQEGYKQARNMLGVLPDNVAAKLEKTMSLIEKMYNEWIDKAGTETQQDNNVNTVVG